MLTKFRYFLLGIAVALVSFIGQNAFAGDNGVIKLDLPDAAAVGMGDAFVGESDRPSAVFYNPAGITQLDDVQLSAGLTWAQPQIKFEASAAAPDGPGYTATMKEDNYLFPDVFVTVPVIKNKLYLGVGETSEFGGGNDWEPNSFSRYSTIKDSIENKDYMLDAAYKVTDQWSVGVGAIDDQSSFEHSEAIYQSPAPDGNVLFKANDNAWGFSLATMFKLNDQNQFGLDYKSPISHVYSGNAYFSNLYMGGGLGNVLGGPSVSTKAVQKLTLPQSVTLGYSLKPTSKWTINFDLGWTDWSQYKEQVTTYPNLTSSQNSYLPGPQSRDWTSVWSESLGVQYAVTDKFRVRTGYEHHQTPVPELTYNTEFPDSDSNAVSFGLGYDITSKLTIDLAYVADFYQSRNVVNADNGFGAFTNGKYSAFVNVGVATLTYKF